jgi:hypothetical protein
MGWLGNGYGHANYGYGMDARTCNFGHGVHGVLLDEESDNMHEACMSAGRWHVVPSTQGSLVGHAGGPGRLRTVK